MNKVILSVILSLFFASCFNSNSKSEKRKTGIKNSQVETIVKLISNSDNNRFLLFSIIQQNDKTYIQFISLNNPPIMKLNEDVAIKKSGIDYLKYKDVFILLSYEDSDSCLVNKLFYIDSIKNNLERFESLIDNSAQPILNKYSYLFNNDSLIFVSKQNLLIH